MNKKNIVENYKKISRWLDDKMLKDAFDGLNTLITEVGKGEYGNRLDQLQTTYKFMLKYTVDGVEDPERQRIYKDLSTSTYRLLDEVKQVLLHNCPDNRMLNEQRNGLAMVSANREQMFTALEKYYSLETLVAADQISGGTHTHAGNIELWKNAEGLFSYFTFTDFYTQNEQTLFKRILDSEYIPWFEKCLMVSAVTFSMMQCYDESKIILLFDSIENSDEEIVQRALVGILVNLYMYDNRLHLSKKIISRLKLLAEDKKRIRNVENIIKQLIQSKETEEITRKLQEEILPEVAKISPHLRNKMDLDNLLGENMQDDKNPDWKDMFDEVPGLTKKMEEFSNLQMEGADVFMSTFSQLKTFPFFSKFLNWLYPFSVKHPDLRSIADQDSNKSFVKAISNTSFLCNSDKYSFLFSISQIPDSYKSMMAAAIEAEAAQVEEIQKDEAFVSPDKKSAYISNQYIQDLYRLFKLHPRKNELADVFKWKLEFFNKSFFRALIEDSQVWRNIGAYYFLKGHYHPALQIFKELLIENPEIELFQKAGYCYQKIGNYKNALTYYHKAELIQSRNLWTLRKIAQCYRALKQSEKALEYYQQAEIIQPDNMAMQLSIGNCYFELGNYDEALKRYFKIEYLDPNNIRGWRPIAWVSFLTGKMDQASKYYKKILESAPNAHDRINAGHLEWCLGNRKKALALYLSSIKEGGITIEKFLEIFNEDKLILLKNKIDKDDIPIMLDRLRYDLAG